MSFIHGYLLAGLLLAGVPVLLHLIMRQKPRHVPFPAFRFLRQRHRINRRRLRLQHLLLLLLRVGVIAALCLALARPRVAADRVAALFSNERSVAAVLVFDTSSSMEYIAAGRSRLDEAKQRARELLDEMDGSSQVSVFDSADEGGGEWTSPARAQAALDALRVRPANAPLNRQIDRAVRLLEKAGEGEDPPPRVLYVFSDRTRACWDKQAGPTKLPDGVRALFVDVGADRPSDLGIEKVEIVPPVVAPGGRVQIQVTLRATGADFDTELLCQIDNDPDSDRPPDRQAVRLAAGQGRVVVFERDAPKSGGEVPYQVTVRHQTPDALPFNNTAHATFLTRTPRKVLTLVSGDVPAGEAPAWKPWKTAMEVVETFQCDVRPAAEAAKLADRELREFAAVCVFEFVPEEALWEKLGRFVRGGGGLVVVPGGEEMLPKLKEFNDGGTKAGLLPGRLVKIEKNAADASLVRWSGFQGDHPIPAFFRKAIQTADPDFGKPQSWPGAYAYWDVEPADKDAVTLANYADAKRRPALLERPAGRGHVVLFTTPMDARELDRNRHWHNYWSDSSFGLVLEDQVCRYLAGESTAPELNYLCGQVPRVPLPSPPPAPPYTLDGPGLAVAETNVKASDGDTQLSLPQAVAPGNYAVRDGGRRVVAGCSLNVRPQEGDLERVPAEQIESVLGDGSLLQVGRTVGLKEAMQGLHPPPVELLPWLMMAVLVVLAVESLLANRFYRRAAPAVEQAQP